MVIFRPYPTRKIEKCLVPIVQIVGTFPHYLILGISISFSSMTAFYILSDIVSISIFSPSSRFKSWATLPLQKFVWQSYVPKTQSTVCETQSRKYQSPSLSLYISVAAASAYYLLLFLSVSIDLLNVPTLIGIYGKRAKWWISRNVRKKYKTLLPNN